MSKNCIKCQSDRLLFIQAHGRDLHFLEINGNEHNGYMPDDIFSNSGGDGVCLDICLNCGQVQDVFPKKEIALEKGDIK